MEVSIGVVGERVMLRFVHGFGTSACSRGWPPAPWHFHCSAHVRSMARSRPPPCSWPRLPPARPAPSAQMMPSLSSSPPAPRVNAGRRLTPVRRHHQGARAGRVPRFPREPAGRARRRRGCSARSTVVRIDPLDRGRCPAKLCAAHVALEGVLEDLLREGYYTQSVALFPGSAI